MRHGVSQGQSIAEFAVVVGVVVLAASAMSVYMRRSTQGWIKGSVDDLLHITAKGVEDISGEETQKRGIEVTRNPAMKDATISDYEATNKSRTEQRYQGMTVRLESESVAQRKGEEIYREIVGPSDPSDKASGKKKGGDLEDELEDGLKKSRPRMPRDRM